MPETSPWAFNLRTAVSAQDSDSEDDIVSSETDIPTSEETSRLNDFDLSNREEFVHYKPNPFSIAKINAACRVARSDATARFISVPKSMDKPLARAKIINAREQDHKQEYLKTRSRAQAVAPNATIMSDGIVIAPDNSGKLLDASATFTPSTDAVPSSIASSHRPSLSPAQTHTTLKSGEKIWSSKLQRPISIPSKKFGASGEPHISTSHAFHRTLAPGRPRPARGSNEHCTLSSPIRTDNRLGVNSHSLSSPPKCLPFTSRPLPRASRIETSIPLPSAASEGHRKTMHRLSTINDPKCINGCGPSASASTKVHRNQLSPNTSKDLSQFNLTARKSSHNTPSKPKRALNLKRDAYNSLPDVEDDEWGTVFLRKKAKISTGKQDSGIRTSSTFTLGSLGLNCDRGGKTGMSAQSSERVITFLPPPRKPSAKICVEAAESSKGTETLADCYDDVLQVSISSEPGEGNGNKLPEPGHEEELVACAVPVELSMSNGSGMAQTSGSPETELLRTLTKRDSLWPFQAYPSPSPLPLDTSIVSQSLSISASKSLASVCDVLCSTYQPPSPPASDTFPAA